MRSMRSRNGLYRAAVRHSDDLHVLQGMELTLYTKGVCTNLTPAAICDIARRADPSCTAAYTELPPSLPIPCRAVTRAPLTLLIYPEDGFLEARQLLHVEAGWGATLRLRYGVLGSEEHLSLMHSVANAKVGRIVCPPERAPIEQAQTVTDKRGRVTALLAHMQNGYTLHITRQGKDTVAEILDNTGHLCEMPLEQVRDSLANEEDYRMERSLRYTATSPLTYFNAAALNRVPFSLEFHFGKSETVSFLPSRLHSTYAALQLCVFCAMGDIIDDLGGYVSMSLPEWELALSLLENLALYPARRLRRTLPTYALLLHAKIPFYGSFRIYFRTVYRSLRKHSRAWLLWVEDMRAVTKATCPSPEDIIEIFGT